jgi:hypothetical protein
MTATEKSSRIGTLFLAVLVFALSLAFLFEWRASRALAAKLSSDLKSALGKLVQEHEVIGSRIAGIGNSLQKTHESLGVQSALLSRLERSEKDGTDASGTSADSITISSGPSLSSQGPTFEAKDLDGLPPLPDGIYPESFLGEDGFANLMTKYQNDSGRGLVGVDLLRAMNLFAEAKARVDVLKSRISLECAQSAQKLLERGDYIDYAPGEKYHTEPGVITYGHDLGERGMRMFYLYPEEFPEIYAMKKEKALVAEIGIRRLLETLNGGAGLPKPAGE